MKGFKAYVRDNANIPNALTLLRILLIPVFVWLYSNNMRGIALIVFITASLTDILDGILARRLNQVTDFGKLADPLADKIMVLTALFMQAIAGVLPWAAVAVVLLKEFVMLSGGLLMLKRGIVVYSIMIGKVAHFVLVVALISSFFHDWFLEKMPQLFMTPDIMLMWLAAALTLAALVGNVAWALRRLREERG